MNIMENKPFLFKGLLAAILLLMLSACQGKDDGFQILVYTDLPQDAVLTGKNKLIDGNFVDQEVQLQLYPGMLERLMVDIVSHTGDILIIEKEMLPSILDPIGLEALDVVVDEDGEEIESELWAEDEDGMERIYAIPIPMEHPIFNGVPFQNELVAVIPKYGDDREKAFTILRQFIVDTSLVQP
ncbi:hypothetical protein [Sutcliffiella horikoshii]|uniref:hypothetical protein n=1 Tax=Sutcliffiella horikoshii TaxID=79883 RepID=UPI001F1E80FB|nr:hypothetical protein [Sutcliffiella horikoshii]MCG1021867.1 hypothetical protein [Sutcliffiella horikoshii]